MTTPRLIVRDLYPTASHCADCGFELSPNVPAMTDNDGDTVCLVCANDRKVRALVQRGDYATASAIASHRHTILNERNARSAR